MCLIIKNDVYFAPSPEPLIHYFNNKSSPVNIEYTKKSDLTEYIIEDEGNRFSELNAMDLMFREDIMEPTILKMCKEIAQEVMFGYKKQVDILQHREIKKSSDEHLLENLMIDNLLAKLASHGRLVAENDDVNKLLDGKLLV